MDRDDFERKYRPRLEKLSTTNVSDALDKIGVRGAVIGIRPIFGLPLVCGRAVTIKITAAGMTKSQHHLGIEAIAAAARSRLLKNPPRMEPSRISCCRFSLQSKQRTSIVSPSSKMVYKNLSLIHI